MNEILGLCERQTLDQSELHFEDPNMLYNSFLNNHLDSFNGFELFQNSIS